MIKFFIITAITEVIFELFFGNKFRRWLKSTKFYQKMVHTCTKAIDRSFSNARQSVLMPNWLLAMSIRKLQNKQKEANNDNGACK